MPIDIKEITNEESVWRGKDIWIAEVNFKMEKPRIIKPMLVRVRHESEAPSNKSIYYSYHYFSPVGKKGEPLSRIIPVYDTTGYRSYAGNPLSAFETEQEAKNWFIEKIGNVIQGRVDRRDQQLEAYDSTTQNYIDLHDEVVGYKSINPKGEPFGKT